MTQDLDIQARRASSRAIGARRGLRRRLTPVQRIAFQIAVIAVTVGIAAMGGIIATRGDAGQAANDGASAAPVHRVASLDQAAGGHA